MSRHPLIAIPGHREDTSSGSMYGALASYCESISAHGGIPLIVPELAAVSEVERLLDIADGVLLPGGVDVHPARYGDEPGPRLGPVDGGLDEFELMLIRHTYDRDKPMLGICRGMQSMAVALGGTLHQDLPSELPGLRHEVREHGRAHLTHDMIIAPDSRLAEILGADTIRVNSLHHQAVRVTPSDLRAVGWSEDGVVEAVEAPHKTFVLGVQSHPEELWNGSEERFSRLFRSFTVATSTAASNSGRPRAST